MTIPLIKIAHATAFIIINARSFQTIATHNQPATPRNWRNIFQGYKLFVVAIIAKTIIMEAIHLIHHVGG
ncbi:uncharacterized protein METZ01_LOCUS142896 [marine metagenome]|uniref:Uncharacterized protein n=1 Tax=marine metagenome TaxID=408172 RepID=A0A381ZMF6_9ZZZZ